MTDIKSLIAHRDPFLFVDEIVSADTNEIIGLKSYDDSFFAFSGSLPEHKLVPGVILIESMIQCGGAGVRKLNLVSDALYGLVAIHTSRFSEVVGPGKVVKMVIKNLKVLDKMIKQSGTAYFEGKVVAEAAWLCVKLK